MSEEAKTKRSVTEVIAQLLNAIPPKEAGVRGALEEVQRYTQYCAPEAEKTLWAKVGQALSDYVGTTFTEPWQREVYKIFTTKDPPQ